MNELIKQFYNHMLSNKDYKLYSVSSRIIKHYYFIHKDYQDNKMNKSVVYKNEYFNDPKILGDNDHSSEVVKSNYLHQLCNEEFIKNKENIKEILFFVEKKNILSFINNTELTNKNKIKLLLSIPISKLELRDMKLQDLDDFVNKNISSESEKEKFFISYFKTRKNQLKESLGKKVEEFLVEKYKSNENKLSPYFSFFNNIKNKFNVVDLDIFEEVPVLFTVRVNVRKASKILSGSNEEKLQKLLENMAYKYAYYNSLRVCFDIIDKSLNIIELRFSQKEQKETNCNQESFIKLFKDFLIEHTSQLNDTNFIELNDKYFKSWCMQRELNQLVPVVQNKSENRNKI